MLNFDPINTGSKLSGNEPVHPVRINENETGGETSFKEIFIDIHRKDSPEHLHSENKTVAGKDLKEKNSHEIKPDLKAINVITGAQIPNQKQPDQVISGLKMAEPDKAVPELHINASFV